MAAIEAARNSYRSARSASTDRDMFAYRLGRRVVLWAGIGKPDETLLLVNDQDTAAHQRIVSSHSPHDRQPLPTRQNHPTLICSTEAR